MGEELKRVIFVFLMMAFLVIVGVFYNELSQSSINSFSGKITSSGEVKEYSPSKLLKEKPFDQQVILQGEVKEILEDYTSKKGYVYQQFEVTDGEKDILIFCSTYRGRKDLDTGKNITFEGKFQKFGSKLEVYGYCKDILSE